MGAVERMLQYLEYKGITKYRFSKDTGLSNGFLDKNRNIGSDKCEIISEVYTDLSMEWLITGRGQMIRSSDNLKRTIRNKSEEKKEGRTEKYLIPTENVNLQEKYEQLKREITMLKAFVARLQTKTVPRVKRVPTRIAQKK
ncbi:hypothetical protein [Capnocytophaga canis]|uniref:hypothetical protein n=1 Tax=Capnocytophaga canis TaxID=1848903 RepID=UPI001561FD6F|nr:hypothetical protein [Capnocytophaga canis]